MSEDENENAELLIIVFVKCKQCGASIMASIGEKVESCKDHRTTSEYVP